LAAATARGEKLGNLNSAAALEIADKGNMASVATIKAGAEHFAADLEPTVAVITRRGSNPPRMIAAELNRPGIVTRCGGAWHTATVRDLIDRQCAA
jgi:hypothetical protein